MRRSQPWRITIFTAEVRRRREKTHVFKSLRLRASAVRMIHRERSDTPKCGYNASAITILPGGSRAALASPPWSALRPFPARALDL